MLGFINENDYEEEPFFFTGTTVYCTSSMLLHEAPMVTEEFEYVVFINRFGKWIKQSVSV